MQAQQKGFWAENIYNEQEEDILLMELISASIKKNILMKSQDLYLCTWLFNALFNGNRHSLKQLH